MQAAEPRIRAGQPETLAVEETLALDDGTVDSGSAAGILDRQPGARADVMETRAAGWGSRRWNREFSGGTGGFSDETRGSDKGPGCSVVEN